MPAPTLEVSQKSLGRVGEFTARCVWTQEDSTDLDSATLLDLDTVSGKFTSVRFALLSVEWSSSEVVTADIEFDSLPWTSDNLVLNIPAGSSGEYDWKDKLDGKKNDPNSSSPGNVVITTRNALPGDELFITGRYIEKGVPLP